MLQGCLFLDRGDVSFVRAQFFFLENIEGSRSEVVSRSVTDSVSICHPVILGTTIFKQGNPSSNEGKGQHPLEFKLVCVTARVRCFFFPPLTLAVDARHRSCRAQLPRCVEASCSLVALVLATRATEHRSRGERRHSALRALAVGKAGAGVYNGGGCAGRCIVAVRVQCGPDYSLFLTFVHEAQEHVSKRDDVPALASSVASAVPQHAETHECVAEAVGLPVPRGRLVSDSLGGRKLYVAADAQLCGFAPPLAGDLMGKLSGVEARTVSVFVQHRDDEATQAGG